MRVLVLLVFNRHILAQISLELFGKNELRYYGKDGLSDGGGVHIIKKLNKKSYSENTVVRFIVIQITLQNLKQ